MLQVATVGRMVHLYSQHIADRDTTQPGYGFNGVGVGPYPAIVTQVFHGPDGAVTYCNLHVIPPCGEAFHLGSVPEGGSVLDISNVTRPHHWKWPDRV